MCNCDQGDRKGNVRPHEGPVLGAGVAAVVTSSALLLLGTGASVILFAKSVG